MKKTKKSIVSLTVVIMVLPGLCFAARTSLKIRFQVGTGISSILPQKSITTSSDCMDVMVNKTVGSQIQVNMSYKLIRQDAVKLKVYNVNGSMIKELVNTDQKPGLHHAVWNVLEKNGTKVSIGVYFLVLDRGSQRITKTITLIK